MKTAEWKTVFVYGPVWNLAQLDAGWYFGRVCVVDGVPDFELDTMVGPFTSQPMAREEAGWAITDAWRTDADFRAENETVTLCGLPFEVTP